VNNFNKNQTAPAEVLLDNRTKWDLHVTTMSKKAMQMLAGIRLKELEEHNQAGKGNTHQSHRDPLSHLRI